MMKKFALLLLLFLGLLNTHAQEIPTDWEVVLFKPAPEAMLYFLNAEGVSQTISLPDLPYSSRLVISDDKRFVLYRVVDEYGSAYSVHLLNLETTESREILGAGIGAYLSVDFSPDMQHVIAVFAFYPDGASEYSMPTYREIVVNLETGEAEIQPEESQLFALWSDEPIPSARYIFTMEGRSPQPFREISGTFRLPEVEERLTRTVVLTPYSGFYDMGDTLINGEHIVSSFAYLIDHTGAETEFYAPIIRYQNSESASYPIWLDRSVSNDYQGLDVSSVNSRFYRARWVMDGQYIYVRPQVLVTRPRFDEIEILGRDGNRNYFELSGDYAFLAGTPDGWLMFRMTNSQTISHFTFENGELIERTLLELPEFVEGFDVLKKPVLGASLQDAVPFPEIEAPRMGI